MLPLLGLLLSTHSLAQITNASSQLRITVSGLIVDPTLAVIPDAPVELRSGATRFVGRTDSRGEFRFEGVPANVYELRAERQGFFETVIKSIPIGEDVRLPPIPLMVGQSGCRAPQFTLEPALQKSVGRIVGQIQEIRYGSSQASALVGKDVLLAEPETRRVLANSRSELDGKFRFTGIEPGRYMLLIQGWEAYVIIATSQWDVTWDPFVVSFQRCPDGGCDASHPPIEPVLTVCE